MRIELEDIRLAYGPRGEHVVIDGLSLSVRSGELLAVLGPSGCGKSTLLGLIAGLRPPQRGRVAFPDWTGPGRPRCLMAFQEHGLLPWLSVLDNACLGLEALGVPRAEREASTLALLARIGLDHAARKRPAELSGGMRQRVALVRLIVSGGDVLLLDEPLSAVDAQTRLFLQQELLDLWSAQPRTAVYVTHDIEEALTLADRVIVLSGKGARILADIPVPSPRPRLATARPAPAIERLRWEIWSLLADGRPGAERAA